MNETEIESMIVRLVGDGVEYQKMLAEAQKATTEAAEHVEEQTHRIEKFTSAVKGFWTGAIQTLSGLGILHFLKEAKAEWYDAETAQVSLASVVRANGRDVEKTMGSYEEYATKMQKVTVHSDEMIMSLLKQAETYELTGKKAETAATHAIQLAAVTGTSAESVLRFVSAMDTGNLPLAMHMKRMIPALRGVTKESELAEKYQRLLASGMEAVNAEAKTGAGRVKIFANAYSDMLEEVGKIFAEIPNPIKILKKEAMELWLSFSDGTKKTVVGTAAVIAGILAVIGVVKLLGVVLGVATGGMSIILGLIITGSTAFVMWADSIGGLQVVWDRVKKAALDAWAWLKPIRQAIVSFAESVWVVLKDVWESVKKAANDAWDSITGNTSINWKKVQEIIVTGVLWMQYAFENMKSIGNLAILWLALKIVTLGEDFTFLFATQIPTILKQLPGFFYSIFQTIEANFRRVIQAMVGNAAHLAKSLPKLLSGRMSIGEFFDGVKMSTEFANKFKEIKIPKREIAALEARIRQEFDAQKGKLIGGFLEFRMKKLAEFGIDPEEIEKAKNEADDMGQQIGKAMGDGFKSERFDAVLFTSAEALQRVSDFQDKMLEGRASLAKGVNGAITNVDKKFESKQLEVTGTASGKAEANVVEKESLGVLENILAGVQIMANHPQLVVKPANIGD